jgi:hypothetical protein
MIEDPAQIHTATAISFLTMESKTCIGEKITSSTNSARKIGYPSVED